MGSVIKDDVTSTGEGQEQETLLTGAHDRCVFLLSVGGCVCPLI